jgi:hypothetical protein
MALRVGSGRGPGLLAPGAGFSLVRVARWPAGEEDPTGPCGACLGKELVLFVVPADLRDQHGQEQHQLAHPGVPATGLDQSAHGDQAPHHTAVRSCTTRGADGSTSAVWHESGTT